MLYLLSERILLKQVSLESESKEGVKKRVSVSVTSTLVTETRKKAVEAAESVGIAEAVNTAEVGKNGKENKGE